MHKLLFALVLLYISSLDQVQGKTSFSIGLIHRDSPLSPSYDETLTPSDVSTRFALRSNSRSRHINAVANGTSTVMSRVYPDGGEYLMTLYIGSPPVPFLAIADTGSDLIWVECATCQRCFSPSNSSTYSTISCSAQTCRILRNISCSTGANACLYDYRYGNGSTYTEGILSTDTISLSSTTLGEIVSFPTSVFGCGYDYAGNFFDWPSSGIVGLGGGPLSLVSQLGDEIDYMFAYCLIHYASNYTSRMKFGQDANLTGPSTPILTNPNQTTFYYLSLLGLSVGKNSTQTPQSPGNIIIDSGTTLTYLNTSLYDEFEALVRLSIPLQPVPDPKNTYSLCYDATAASSVNATYITFHFVGVDLVLFDVNNFFLPNYNNTVCLSIVPTDGLSIFGNLAQMGVAVGYNLKLRTVTFAAANCTEF